MIVHLSAQRIMVKDCKKLGYSWFTICMIVCRKNLDTFLHVHKTKHNRRKELIVGPERCLSLKCAIYSSNNSKEPRVESEFLSHPSKISRHMRDKQGSILRIGLACRKIKAGGRGHFIYRNCPPTNLNNNIDVAGIGKFP